MVFSMTFFPTNEIPEKTESVDFRRAQKLFQALVKHNKNKSSRYNAPAWARAFLKLRNEAGPKTINAVLSWYCKNMGGEFVPVAYSAVSFRQKFSRIYDAMIRGNPGPEKVVINPEAEICLKEAGFPIWRGGEMKDELEFVQASLNNYENFCDALEDFYENESGDSAAVANWLRGYLSAEPVTAIANWIREVHSISLYWEQWDGSLLNWIWKPEQKLVRRRLRYAVAKFTGMPLDFDLLYTAINARKFR